MSFSIKRIDDNVKKNESEAFTTLQAIDPYAQTFIDFDFIFDDNEYSAGFKDYYFSNFCKNRLNQNTKLVSLIYTPEKQVDVSFLGKIKSLVDINIPLNKIKNLDFVLNMPSLETIGSYQDIMKNEQYGISILKKKIKYKKNTKLMLN